MNNFDGCYLIDDFPWGRPEIYPKAFASLNFTSDAIEVRLCAKEKFIRATIKEDNGPVYKDSCLEFFFCPMPDTSEAYFNFEINPLGTLYVGFSPDGTRKSSSAIDYSAFKKEINVKTFKDEDCWEAVYRVPYSLIKFFMPEFSLKEKGYIKGNFYKCGDDTKYPHYAVWSHIDSNDVIYPDFHITKYFMNIYY